MPGDQLQAYYRQKISREGYDLFAVFARFEYAMKKGGFRKANAADAAWWTFADSLPPVFFRTMQSAPEAQILFLAPPRRLECDAQGGVVWSAQQRAPNDARELFEIIKIIRNNLLHGEKKHSVDRDNELSKAALFVLNSVFDVVIPEQRFAGFVSAMEFGL